MTTNKDGLVIAEDNADPTKSTGNFEYTKSKVIFREQCKFRVEMKDIIETATVSL